MDKKNYEQGERLGRFLLRNIILRAIYKGAESDRYQAIINDFLTNDLPKQDFSNPYDRRVFVNYSYLSDEALLRHNMFVHWLTALEKAYLHLLLVAGRWTLGAEGVKNLPPIMQEAMEANGKEGGIKKLHAEAIEAYRNALAEAEYLRLISVVWLDDGTLFENLDNLHKVAEECKALLEGLPLFEGLDASGLESELPAANVKKMMKAFRKISLLDSHNTGVQSRFTTYALTGDK